MTALTIPYSATEGLQQVRSLLNEPTASYWTDAELNQWIQEATIDISTKTLCFENNGEISLVSTPVLTYGDLPRYTNDTFAFVDSNPDTITDSDNWFINAGFRVGMVITVSGAGEAGNNSSFTITIVAAGTLTLTTTTDVLTTESAGSTVTILGDIATEDIIKVYGVAYYDNTNTYRGLMKIHPRSIHHFEPSDAGEPFYWWHFADQLGVFPVSNATVVTAEGRIKVFYSMSEETFANLPYHYQLATIFYAVSMARKKQGMIAEANQFYAIYMNSLAFSRADLYERGVDSKDMFQIPDGTRVVGR